MTKQRIRKWTHTADAELMAAIEDMRPLTKAYRTAGLPKQDWWGAVAMRVKEITVTGAAARRRSEHISNPRPTVESLRNNGQMSIDDVTLPPDCVEVAAPDGEMTDYHTITLPTPIERIATALERIAIAMER